MLSSFNRRRLPASVRDALDLTRGERVLAHAPTRGGSHVVATVLALHLPTGDGAFIRLPWDRIERATWDKGGLDVHETSGGRAHHIGLTDPGSVPETIRERVTSTVAVTHPAVLPGGGKVRVTGRRSPATGDLRWSFMFEAGLDPNDPGLLAQAEQVLEDLRRQTGL
ncbi:hypothetical protein [Thermomonospora umbrina]|uniref:Uncharacterized protein n=1 Tax=Thermomonospora umbrina TaxID=111806 RepID=A0A3D9STT4_9ACTN|nr:hypothetical protein [Thermomonospora umbrina]REE99366.1 hypothetical protein DFJ69_4876 [Thermomonospora umbrina]